MVEQFAMTVTGSWMDVDYFTFVKGKNATDPEPIGGDSSTTFASGNFHVTTEVENYRIFDINGNYMGKLRATGMRELQDRAKTLVQRPGVYLVRSTSGKVVRIQVR